MVRRWTPSHEEKCYYRKLEISDNVWAYGGSRQKVIDATDRPADSSMLTKSSPSTHLQKILCMEEWKSSTNCCTYNTPSLLPVSHNRMLVNKATKKEVMSGTTEGLDGTLLQSLTQMRF